MVGKEIETRRKNLSVILYHEFKKNEKIIKIMREESDIRDLTEFETREFTNLKETNQITNFGNPQDNFKLINFYDLIFELNIIIKNYRNTHYPPFKAIGTIGGSRPIKIIGSGYENITKKLNKYKEDIKQFFKNNNIGNLFYGLYNYIKTQIGLNNENGK